MLYVITKSKQDAIKRFWGPVLRGSGVGHQFVASVGHLPELDAEKDVVLLTGKSALELLEEQKLARKKSTLGSNRGKVFMVEYPTGTARTLASYDASLVWTDYGRLIDIQWDLRLAMRLHETGTLAPQTGHYRWVTDFSDLIAWIKKRLDSSPKAVTLTCDLETVGLNAFDPEKFIVSISFTYKPGQADAIRFKGLHDQPCNQLHSQIEWLLTHPRIKVRGANFKYDLRWIRHKWGIRCTNFSMDTTLVGSLLDENSSNSLTAHANQRTNMGGYDAEFNEKYDKGRMDLIPDDDLLEYAGGDTDACYQVADSMTSTPTRWAEAHPTKLE
jgi:hypothetical protein